MRIKRGCVAAGTCRDGLLQQLLHQLQRSWVLRVGQAGALLAGSRCLQAIQDKQRQHRQHRQQQGRR
jgi:hypothetical protein